MVFTQAVLDRAAASSAGDSGPLLREHGLQRGGAVVHGTAADRGARLGLLAHPRQRLRLGDAVAIHGLLG